MTKKTRSGGFFYVGIIRERWSDAALQGVACPTGIEPVTPSLEGSCSIRLSYGQMDENMTHKICHINYAAQKEKRAVISDSPLIIGRSTRIRTLDPLVPNQVRYRAALHSEVKNYTRPSKVCQVIRRISPYSWIPVVYRINLSHQFISLRDKRCGKVLQVVHQ